MRTWLAGAVIGVVVLGGCGASNATKEPPRAEEAAAPVAPSETDDEAASSTRPPAARSSERIAELVASLDEDADPLHADFTPAVHALSELGPPAALAVLDLLGSEDEMTRLHALRVVEGVVVRLYGFRPGRGFPEGSPGDAEARALLQRFAYDRDAPREARARAIERIRAWLLDVGAELRPDRATDAGRDRGGARAGDA